MDYTNSFRRRHRLIGRPQRYSNDAYIPPNIIQEAVKQKLCLDCFDKFYHVLYGCSIFGKQRPETLDRYPCKVCSYRRQLSLPYKDNVPKYPSGIVLGIPSFKDPFEININGIEMEKHGLKASHWQVRLSSHPAQDTHGLTAEDDIKSPFNFKQLKKWIEGCEENHNCYESTASDRDLPTRLIDIGVERWIRPKIILTNQLPKDTRYMTLSHCWGKRKMMKLQTSTMDNMMKGIHFLGLPKTFKHAMLICQSLNCRYLWIDSLCIVQDDDDDWRHEGAKMGIVYRHTWCNIVAAAAKNGKRGCFPRRKRGSIRAITIEVPERFTELHGKSSESSHTSSTVADIGSSGNQLRPGDRYTFCDDNFWANSIDSLPSQQRGWILQEQVLAPRNIYCGEHQIFWECSQLHACETFPQGFPGKEGALNLPSIPPSFYYDRYLIGRASPTREGREMFSSGYISESFEGWSNLVAIYTRKTLSFPEKDKLLAISGLIKKFQHLGTFQAGLWEESLPFYLLWQKVKASHNGVGLLPHAPSWSWLATDGPVQFQTKRGQLILTTIRGISGGCGFGMDSFSSATDGGICIRGPFVNLPIQHWYPNNGPEMRAEGGSEQRVINVTTWIDDDRGFYNVTRHRKLGGIIISETSGSYQGLVLRNVSSSAVYRRLGVFNIYKSAIGDSRFMYLDDEHHSKEFNEATKMWEFEITVV